MERASPPFIKNATLRWSVAYISWNYDWNQTLDLFMEFILLNRRMPKCNTVLQNENDLFEHEIQPNSPKTASFWPFFVL